MGYGKGGCLKQKSIISRKLGKIGMIKQNLQFTAYNKAIGLLEVSIAATNSLFKTGSFPAGTPGNGVPKVIFTVGTAFPGIQ